MTSADSIDVKLLHDLNIPDHISLRYYISLIWVQFMSVRAFDQDRLAVYEKLRISDAYIPETDLNGSRLGLALLVE